MRRFLFFLCLYAGLSYAADFRNLGFEKTVIPWIVEGTGKLVGYSVDPNTVYGTAAGLDTVLFGQSALKLGDEIPWNYGGPINSRVYQVQPISSGETDILHFSVVAAKRGGETDAHRPYYQLSLYDQTTGETIQVWQETIPGGSIDALPATWHRGGDYYDGSNQANWIWKEWTPAVFVIPQARQGHTLRLQAFVSDCRVTANPADVKHPGYMYLDGNYPAEPMPLGRQGRICYVKNVVRDPATGEIVQTGNLYVKDLETGQESQVTNFAGTYCILNPQFTSDGKRIICTSNVNYNGNTNYKVFCLDPNGIFITGP